MIIPQFSCKKLQDLAADIFNIYKTSKKTATSCGIFVRNLAWQGIQYYEYAAKSFHRLARFCSKFVRLVWKLQDLGRCVDSSHFEYQRSPIFWEKNECYFITNLLSRLGWKYNMKFLRALTLKLNKFQSNRPCMTVTILISCSVLSHKTNCIENAALRPATELHWASLRFPRCRLVWPVFCVKFADRG